MAIDDRALNELLEESEDLQADALRDLSSHNDDLADIREDRRRDSVDPDEIDRVNASRRLAVRTGGLGLGTLAMAGAAGTALAGAVSGLVAGPAAADTPMDIQILQTAASLENLAVATYGAALKLPFIQSQAVVKKFAETTMKQHKEHGDAFNAQTTQLGGKAQDQPNPKYLTVVNQAKPGLTDAAKVVDLAMALETVATETYVNNMTLLGDTKTKEIMASVMGVESQHLATLRAVAALLAGGAPQLIAIPTDVTKLPAAAGSVAFPQPFQAIDMASPPAEGAVK